MQIKSKLLALILLDNLGITEPVIKDLKMPNSLCG